MDVNASKKKALEILAARRPAPAAPVMPGGNGAAPQMQSTGATTPSVASRFADVIARNKGMARK